MEWTSNEIRYCLDSESTSEAAKRAVSFAADEIEEQAEEIERLEARVAELEATQTPEHIAAWKHWAKLEGAREEREAVVAWLRAKAVRLRDMEDDWYFSTNGNALSIERGEHEKGEAK